MMIDPGAPAADLTAPAAIVSALAAQNAPTDSEYADCLLCDATEPGSEPATHDPICPWRRAREWVDAQARAEVS